MEKYRFIRHIVARQLARKDADGIHRMYGNKYYVANDRHGDGVECTVTKAFGPFYRELVRFRYDRGERTLGIARDFDREAAETLVSAFREALGPGRLRLGMF